MSVTPSPIGGFAAQFFDNNGVILSGGKIYTYAAGTTTPQTSYTSAAGVTPHANPIILDSAGRVPGGEIWLTDGLVYKFVIETAASILIGTYDNITGVNSNFVNYTVQEEVITATAGQTVFDLATINYTPGTNSLTVYIDGVNQYVGDSYLETDSDTVTFTSGVHVGGEVKFTTAVQTTTGAVDASIVSYEPPFTGGVATNVEAKLAQYVSVKDFGAVGDGVTDDTAAFNTAIAYLNTISYSAVLVLEGDFVINGSLTPITTPRKVIDGYGATINHDGGTLFSFGVGGNTGIVKGIRYSCPTSPTAGTCFISLEGCNQCEVRDITGRVNQFAKVGLSSFVGGYIFENVNVSTINGVQTVIDHGTGAVSQINNLVLTAIGTSRVLDQTTPTGATATAIKFSNAWDTAIWSGLLVNGYLYGLDINRTTASVNISNGRVTNFYFDFCANGIRMKNTALGGGINNWYFSNGWSVGMDGYSIDIDAGSFANIKFEAVQALLAGKNNWRINGSGFTDITIENCVGQFANRYNATNTGTDQDDFVALSGLFRVFNSQFGQSANNFVTAGVPNWQGRYGMNIATAFITKYFIQGNQMQGLTADCNFSTANNILPVASEYSGFISNNMVYSGASRPAYAITDTLAAPLSGVVQTYRNPFYLELSIYGGTVTDIMHNGVTIATGGPVSLQLSPGDTWSVTYTVAPTIRRVFKP